MINSGMIIGSIGLTFGQMFVLIVCGLLAFVVYPGMLTVAFVLGVVLGIWQGYRWHVEGLEG